MKTQITRFSILVCILLNISCETNRTETENPTNDPVNYETSDLDFNYLGISKNVYTDYLQPTDKFLGFSAVKNDPLREHEVFSRVKLKDGNDNMRLSINGREISTIVNNSANNISDDIFGQTNKFLLTNSLQEMRTSDSKVEVEMYVPKKINISNPMVSKKEELMPYCWYEDFVLEWNTDPKNEEGLFIVVEYFGANISHSDNNSPSVINTDFIESDNGRTVLDNALWDGIPHGAIVYLTLMRGNVQFEKLDGEVIKLYAETHAELPIMLLKDMSRVIID